MPRPGRPWTRDEIDKLTELCAQGVGTAAVVAAFPYRTPGTVRHKAYTLRLSLRTRDADGIATYRGGQLLGQPQGESWRGDERRREALDGEVDETIIAQAHKVLTSGPRRRRLCVVCGEKPAMTIRDDLCFECSEDARIEAYRAGTEDERRAERYRLRHAAELYERRARECRDALERLKDSVTRSA